MLVVGFPAPAFATNCWVIAPAAGEECLVVDPGIGVLEELSDLLATHRLRPAAVLATHGHLDHVYSVTPICGAHGVALMLHADDAYRLRDPLAGLSPALIVALEQQFGTSASWAEPDDVRSLRDGDEFDLAGLRVTVDHAPGHTEGSVMFRLPVTSGLEIRHAVAALRPPGVMDGWTRDASEVVVAGDVLFAGSIGRCDLAGGDPGAMTASLTAKVLPLADDALVLPGHGPRTSIGVERVGNPFLLGLRHPAG